MSWTEANKHLSKDEHVRGGLFLRLWNLMSSINLQELFKLNYPCKYYICWSRAWIYSNYIPQDWLDTCFSPFWLHVFPPQIPQQVHQPATAKRPKTREAVMNRNRTNQIFTNHIPWVDPTRKEPAETNGNVTFQESQVVVFSASFGFVSNFCFI